MSTRIARHPRKRERRSPRARCRCGVALALAAALALGGLGLAAAVRLELAAVGCRYLLLTACYSLWLRHVIVAGHARDRRRLRAARVAGGAATGVGLSRWFLLVTSFGAIFVVAGKRHAELFGRADEARHGLTRGDAAALLRARPAARSLGAAALRR